MALILSTGFEGPWSSSETTEQIFDVVFRNVVNQLYFQRCPIHTWGQAIQNNTVHPSIGQGHGPSSGIKYCKLDGFTGGTAVSGWGTVVGSQNTALATTLILSGTSFPNGFYCSYRTYMNTDSVDGRGVHHFGIINHNDTTYWLQWRTATLNSPPAGDEGTLAIIDLVGNNKEWYNPGNTFNAINQTGRANLGNDTPIVRLKEVNDVKIGITPSGVIKFRINDIETQYDTGTTWNPALSDFIGFSCPIQITGDLSSNTTLYSAIDDLTIQDSLSGVDNDLPPIYQGRNVAKAQNGYLENWTIEDGDTTIKGLVYEIENQNNLDFTLIGAPNNNEGTVFRCNSAGILGAKDILLERESCRELNVDGPNSPDPIGIDPNDTNAHVLFDYDSATYSNFTPGEHFSVDFPPISAVVAGGPGPTTSSTLSGLSGKSVFFNITLRNLGIDTASNMTARVSIPGNDKDKNFLVGSPETYGGFFAAYKSGSDHYNVTDYDSATGTVIRP